MRRTALSTLAAAIIMGVAASLTGCTDPAAGKDNLVDPALATVTPKPARAAVDHVPDKSFGRMRAV